MTTQPYKGSRDFYPEDKLFQKWVFATWRNVVEKYGYVEYDAPILEPTDLYLMKGSEEIVREQTYTFLDRGSRSVTIRTEMTPSVSRMVAGRRQELSYPARWYSIPNLWRYERMQRGRLREFWQLNVDSFGIASVDAEFEMIQIIDELFQSFKAKRSYYSIKVNSRVLIQTILARQGLDVEQSNAAIRLIDRIHKLPVAEFATKLDEITKSTEISASIVSILKINDVRLLPDDLKTTESVKNLLFILDNSKSHGIHNVEFDMTLMRGFDYYTDIVFEAFDTDPENNRAILGGGRYDGLVGLFGVEPIATVGFAVGDVVFSDFLRTHKLVPNLHNTNKITLLLEDEQLTQKAKRVASELREMGVNTSVDFTYRKIDKQLKSAIKSGVRFVIFIKIDDDDTLFSLKDLTTGKEEKHSLQRIVSIVQDARVR